MATVRIYKVAEALNTSSQEIIALLREEHGIEVKSASSTIEEVVARQFVERLARDRGLTLPSGPLFADAPAAKSKRRPARAEEPPKPAPSLPPPRLVKTRRPPPTEVPAEEGAAAVAEADAGEAVADVEPAVTAEPMVEEAAAVEEVPGAGAELGEAGPVAAGADAGAVESAAPVEAPARRLSTRRGHVVPPQLRLRVEEPAGAREKPTPPPPAPPPPEPKKPAARLVATPAAAETARPAITPKTGSRVSPSPSRPLPEKAAKPEPRPAAPARTTYTPTYRPTYSPTPGALPGAPSYRPPGPGYRPPAGRPGGRGRVSHRRDRGPRPSTPAQVVAPPPPITRSITLAEGMTVKDLADKLEIKAKDVLKRLLERRMVMTINTTLDADTAATIAREFGADVEMRTFEEEMVEAEAEASSPEDLAPRAPVVTVMGHVDHGKTTLLDAIRETRVAEREAGGITQHIGAYVVEINSRRIVFLDTPGHEAFTMMRARGARVTDVVVLVVAADDGVMPQTREAIDHAKAANVPIVVAINKIDKPDANPDRVKKELSELGLMPEDWGGQTVTVAVSAKQNQNLDLLLEMILLVTELGELKANPKRSASGTVLEAKLDRGRGAVATMLVQDGTLEVGDTVLAGTVVGKIRALIDDRGRSVRSAGPSTPVEVLGLGSVPQPGDTVQALADAAKARQIAVFRQNQAKERALGAKTPRLTLESLQQQIATGDVKELPIIIKADVQGSAEVLADTLAKLGDERVKIRVVHAGVGAINESDVLLASASNAIVVGFNVRPDRNAADVAERESVDIRLHSVIYNVTDEIKKAMTGLLEPTIREVRLGSAEVRQTFKVPKFGTVAGCMVIDGRIVRSGDSQARLLRDNVVVFEGKLGSLRRFKDDVSEVKSGLECGIGFERYNDIKVGDVIEVFTVERVAASV